MTGARATTVLILFGVTLAGGVLGWFAAPWLARSNYIVELAERVWLEESGLLEGDVLQSEAFRKTGGIPLEQLYSEANRIRDKFRIGATALGILLGLVVGMKLLGLAVEAERAEYEADPALCLACTRCYDACPVEHERRGTIMPVDARVAEALAASRMPATAGKGKADADADA